MNPIQMKAIVGHSTRAMFLGLLKICLLVSFSFGCTTNPNTVPSATLISSDIPTTVPTRTSVPPTRTPVPTATPIATEAEINQAVDNLIRYYELKMVESTLAHLPESPSTATLPSDVRGQLTREYILLNQALRDGSSLYPLSGILNELINASNRAYLKEVWTPIVAQNPQIIATMNRTLPTFITMQQPSSSFGEVVDDLLTQLPEDKLTLFTRTNPRTFITQVVQNEGNLPNAFRALRAADEFSDTIQVLDDAITSQPNLVRANSLRGPPAIDIARDPQAADLATRYTRSYSDVFSPDNPQSSSPEALQQRSDVGGVIIGRMPTTSAIYNIVDIRWELDEQDRTIVLTLIDNRGQEITSIAYDAGIANQSLTYAVDGRLLAVTNIPSTLTSLSYNEIILHPALVDTTLGNNVIELDSYVFESANEFNIAYPDMQLQCYLKAYDLTISFRSLMVDLYENNNRRMPTFEAIKREIELEGDRSLEELIPCDPNQIANTSPSTFNQYFDTNIRESLTGYFNQDSRDSLQSFLSYLYDIFKAKIESASAIELGRWTSSDYTVSLPAFECCFSHVTETPFEVNLTSLLLRNSPSRELSLLDFTWQINFENTGTSGLSTIWQFPLPRERVDVYVEQRQHRQDVMENVIQFTMLQRLFRMILTNRVDPDFPVEKLIGLADALKDYTPEYARTSRWDVTSFTNETECINTVRNNPVMRQLDLEADCRIANDNEWFVSQR